jgi:hypothetical protein
MALIKVKLIDGVSDVKIKITFSGTTPVLAGYVYELKANNSNAPIEERIGDNLSSQDDIYPLPTPIQENIGRKVVLTSKIAAIDRDSDYEVKMEVIQDGIITDTLTTPPERHVDANGEADLSLDIIMFI